MTKDFDGRAKTSVPVILSYPALTKAEQFKGKGDFYFSSEFILDAGSDDFKSFWSIAVAAAKAAFPGRDVVAEWKQGLFAFPFKKGEDIIKEKQEAAVEAGKDYDGKADHLKGKIVLKGKTKIPPSLAVFEGGKLSDVTPQNTGLHEKKFYGGCEALVELNFTTYEVNGNPGVKAYINSVVSLNKGKAFGNQRSAVDTFKDYVGHASGESVTGGSDAEAFG